MCLQGNPTLEINSPDIVMTTHKVLVLGASYGMLLGIKLAMAGNEVNFVCRPEEADAINRDGVIVRLPVRGRDPVEIESMALPCNVSASTPEETDPAGYDLIALAMQEPQYCASNVRELVETIAKSGVCCMSIMNMPPLVYLKRIPGVDTRAFAASYTDPSVWDAFDPLKFTHCSPDPQAFRPAGEALNVLQVTLPTNFKAAAFATDEDTKMLRDMQAGIEAIRFSVGDEKIQLPVKLKVHDSIFVPLAKWAMLITGNYRCVTERGIRSISEAVHSNIEMSREIYSWVQELCFKIGASRDDLVPFEKYAAVSRELVSPSSAARALFSGAKRIERVDRLVQALARQMNMKNDVIDGLVALVDAYLERNESRTG